MSPNNIEKPKKTQQNRSLLSDAAQVKKSSTVETSFNELLSTKRNEIIEKILDNPLIKKRGSTISLPEGTIDSVQLILARLRQFKTKRTSRGLNA